MGTAYECKSHLGHKSNSNILFLATNINMVSFLVVINTNILDFKLTSQCTFNKYYSHILGNNHTG